MTIDVVIGMRSVSPTFANKLHVAERNWKAKRAGAVVSIAAASSTVGRTFRVTHSIHERFNIGNEAEYFKCVGKKPTTG